MGVQVEVLVSLRSRSTHSRGQFKDLRAPPTRPCRMFDHPYCNKASSTQALLCVELSSRPGQVVSCHLSQHFLGDEKQPRCWSVGSTEHARILEYLCLLRAREPGALPEIMSRTISSQACDMICAHATFSTRFPDRYTVSTTRSQLAISCRLSHRPPRRISPPTLAFLAGCFLKRPTTSCPCR